MEKIKLIGENYQDRMMIIINPKNVKFIVAVDGTGESFSINKQELIDSLNR